MRRAALGFGDGSRGEAEDASRACGVLGSSRCGAAGTKALLGSGERIDQPVPRSTARVSIDCHATAVERVDLTGSDDPRSCQFTKTTLDCERPRGLLCSAHRTSSTDRARYGASVIACNEAICWVYAASPQSPSTSRSPRPLPPNQLPRTDGSAQRGLL